jgi:hypothetical protein
MAAGGYRVELDRLRAVERGLRDLSDEVRDSIGEPLIPPAGGNRGFASAQTVVAVADAWQAETGDLGTALRSAGEKLAATAAEYHRADVCGAHEFQRILRGS